MPTLTAPSTVTFSLQVDQILTVTNNFGAGRIVLSAQRGGDVVFDYTSDNFLNTPVFSSGSQGLVTITHLAGSLTYNVNTSAFGLDSPEVASTRALLSGAGTLASILLQARQSAVGANPFDFSASATQPLVSAVTIGAAAYAAPVSHGYFDVGGSNKIKLIGVPDGLQTAPVINANSGYAGVRNASSVSGSTLSYADSKRGSAFIESLITCSSVQINVRGVGLSSNYMPIWVNGILVAPTPGSLGNPTGNVQLDFTGRGTYKIGVGMEQSVYLKGFTVSEDDTVHPFTSLRPPIMLYGDSYTFGATSPQTIGGFSIPGAISLIGGLNCIALGVTSIGYINDGGTNLPFTNGARLAELASLTNSSGARAIVVFGGYNDVSILATSAAVQAAAASVISYLLANTTANIMLTGAQTANRNNSAATQTVDAGIQAAVTAAASNRVAFVPISGATPAWISGTRDTANTTGLIAGNSRYFTGTDGTHVSPFITTPPAIPANTTPSSGVEYYARRIVDALILTATAQRWS